MSRETWKRDCASWCPPIPLGNRHNAWRAPSQKEPPPRTRISETCGRGCGACVPVQRVRDSDSLLIIPLVALRRDVAFDLVSGAEHGLRGQVGSILVAGAPGRERSPSRDVAEMATPLFLSPVIWARLFASLGLGMYLRRVSKRTGRCGPTAPHLHRPCRSSSEAVYRFKGVWQQESSQRPQRENLSPTQRTYPPRNASSSTGAGRLGAVKGEEGKRGRGWGWVPSLKPNPPVVLKPFLAVVQRAEQVVTVLDLSQLAEGA